MFVDLSPFLTALLIAVLALPLITVTLGRGRTVAASSGSEPRRGFS